MSSTVAGKGAWAATMLLVCASACHGKGTSDGQRVQGNGVAKTETRDVGAFDSVELDGALQVELVSAPVAKLTLTGDANVLPLITTSVSGGKLIVRETRDVQQKTALVLTIEAPSLAQVDVNGSASLHATGLVGPRFALRSQGASTAQLAGQVDKLEIDVGGAGRVWASALVAKDVRVGISGAGSVEVDAVNKLKADVSGVGSVRYSGTPSVEKTVTGVGSVKPF